MQQAKSPSRHAEAVNKRPNIYDFLDYRAYLRAIYAYLKRSERGFSYRKFAARAGYNAPNNLKRVMDGQRKLTPESIERFVEGLRLGKAEAEYFEALVYWQQASDVTTRKHYEALLRRRAAYFKNDTLALAAYEYLSGIVPAAVREAINRAGVPQSSDAIKDALYFPVSRAELERALDVLKRLKLIEQKRGRWQQTRNVVRSEDEIVFIAAKAYHREAIAWASAVFDRVPRNERLLGGVTASISESRFAELREFLTAQRHQLAAFLAEDDGQPIARVVQINYQMFPLTRPLGAAKP